MVVSAREEASKIGVEILKQGGNAFDAMMATEMALAVTFPFAGNLGGGGFMVYRMADGQIGSLDYREKAPLAASKDMYLDKDGNVIPQLSTLGILASGVPGTLAGIFEAQAKFGKLSPKQVLQPVIDLARNGYVVTKNQAESLKNHRQIFIQVNGPNTFFGNEIKAGDTLRLWSELPTKGKMSFTKVRRQRSWSIIFKKMEESFPKRTLFSTKPFGEIPLFSPTET
jgi:gamma-glutamyltranspeptidase/glutathione hydrolase